METNQDVAFVQDPVNGDYPHVACSYSADLKIKRICPDGSYGLFLTCGKKIGQSLA
jgi:hypothetical protein